MKDQDALLPRIAERLKALADPTRLKILHVLEEGERCVSEILEAVGGSQANVSKHLGHDAARRILGRLPAAGINVYYRVTDSTSLAICRTVCAVLEKQAAAEHREIKRARAASGGFA